MEKIKVLITGADGFIGKSLCELLDKSKYTIVAKGHKELDLTDMIQVKDFFKKNKIDHIIHTAVVGGGRRDDNAKIFLQNVQMFENLIFWKDYYKSMITFGSGAETDEGSFPLNYYGLSKKYITEKVYKQKLNNVTILRIWGCFGKNEDSTRFIKNNINRYKNKIPLMIHGDRKMSFIYINDLVQIVDYFLDKPGSIIREVSKGIDICYDQPYTLSEIASLINNLDTHKSEIQYIGNPIKDYCGVSSPFLDNFKLIGMEEGIKQVYSSIK